MMRQRKDALVFLAAGAGVLFAVAGAGFWGGLRINLTPSYPLGIWWIEPLDREARGGPLADRGSPGRTHGNAVFNPRIRVCSTVVFKTLSPALRNRFILATTHLPW